MQDFFYWMGVIYSGLFLMLGAGIFSGLVMNYFYGKLRDIHGMTELMTALREHKKGKQ